MPDYNLDLFSWRPPAEPAPAEPEAAPVASEPAPAEPEAAPVASEASPEGDETRFKLLGASFDESSGADTPRRPRRADVVMLVEEEPESAIPDADNDPGEDGDADDGGEDEGAAADASEPAPTRRRRRRRSRDDDSKGRARTVSGRQQELVLGVLRRAYPNAVSHAEICKEVGTNRASHRIRELIRVGWSIEGAGILGLDPISQTQLYRLSSLEQGDAYVKHVGLKVLWDSDGLQVSLHRDIDGDLEGAVLRRAARRIEALVREDLAGFIPLSAGGALDPEAQPGDEDGATDGGGEE